MVYWVNSTREASFDPKMGWQSMEHRQYEIPELQKKMFLKTGLLMTLYGRGDEHSQAQGFGTLDLAYLCLTVLQCFSHPLYTF